MTNGEKIKQIFPGLWIDEGELYAYLWLPCHDAIDIPLEWWNEEYKEPDHIADAGKMIESTPNDCETCIHNKGVLECDMYGCKYEPTTKTCRTCGNFGSHHGICEICKDNKCWTEKEPTTVGKDVLVGFKQGVDNIRTLSQMTPQEPFINKPCVSGEVCEHDKQKVLDKLRAEITQYGSIWVGYTITKDTKTDKGIEKLVRDVLKQAKEQVLEIIDKYRAGTEEENVSL